MINHVHRLLPSKVALSHHGESMINCIKYAKVSQKIRVISLVRVLWEIKFAHGIKDIINVFWIIDFMFVMCGAYDAMRSRQ